MCVCALTCTLSAPSVIALRRLKTLLQTGFDFLLDSSCKAWLLEVNASPSMAWDTTGQPGASQLMYSVKQQMLLDMFALLRLQDRYPAQQQRPPDAAEGQPATAAGGDKRPPRLRADEGLNPVLLQAASEAYFSSRPKVAAMVAADARQLQAAVAAAPAREEVEAGVALLLQQLETAPGSGSQQQEEVAGVLRTHMRQLVQVECELRSGAGWQSLLPHVPSRRDAAKQGWRLHSSRADAAVASWLRLRSMVPVERAAPQAV